MKTSQFLVVICSSLFFWGCSKYQFVYVEEYANNTERGYLIENDSLEIRYNFSGDNVPVNIRIENKSDKPIYIDWKKSAAIVDGQKTGYWQDISNVDLEGWSGMHFSAAGTIQRDEQVTFIPPFSYIETTRLFLQTSLFRLLPEDAVQRTTIKTTGGEAKIKKYHFTEESSPLVFRSIIAVSPREDFARETFFENTFWVSEIFESSQKLTYYSSKQPHGTNRLTNTSLISKMTGFGKTAGAVGLLGALTGLIYLSSENSSE